MHSDITFKYEIPQESVEELGPDPVTRPERVAELSVPLISAAIATESKYHVRVFSTLNMSESPGTPPMNSEFSYRVRMKRLGEVTEPDPLVSALDYFLQNVNQIPKDPHGEGALVLKVTAYASLHRDSKK